MLYALNDPLASFVFIDCIIVWKCMLKCVLRVRINIYNSFRWRSIRLFNCLPMYLRSILRFMPQLGMFLESVKDLQQQPG